MGGLAGQPFFAAVGYVAGGVGGKAETNRRKIKIIDQAARRGVDWFVWRVVTDDLIPDGLTQIRRWPFADLLEAHLFLDAVHAIHAIDRPPSGR